MFGLIVAGFANHALAEGAPDAPPKHISVEWVDVPDCAYQNEVVVVRAIVRAFGYEPGHRVTLRLTDAFTRALSLAPTEIRQRTQSPLLIPSQQQLNSASIPVDRAR